jgi:uncharacterized protein (TIGR02271 family)
MGVPEDEARHYEDQVRQGKILVTVRADNDNEADRASDIMEEQGAVDVEGTSRHDRVAESAPSATNVSEYERRDEGRLDRQDLRTTDTAPIPVTEEQLVVGKRAVEGGRVRVYGRVSEKPVEESVRLREERINVERRAVDRPVTDADRKDDVMIELTETREEPVVGKQERVVEEIVVGKTAEERTETVRDTVRRKDVEVEKTGSEPDERARGRR